MCMYVCLMASGALTIGTHGICTQFTASTSEQSQRGITNNYARLWKYEGGIEASIFISTEQRYPSRTPTTNIHTETCISIGKWLNWKVWNEICYLVIRVNRWKEGRDEWLNGWHKYITQMQKCILIYIVLYFHWKASLNIYWNEFSENYSVCQLEDTDTWNKGKNKNT